MKNEQARIREAVRKIDMAERWLVNNAFPPDPPHSYRDWQGLVTSWRRERIEAVEELIDACRKYLKPRG